MVLVVRLRPGILVPYPDTLHRRNTGNYCILRLRVPKDYVLDFLHRPLSCVGVPSRHSGF